MYFLFGRCPKSLFYINLLYKNLWFSSCQYCIAAVSNVELNRIQLNLGMDILISISNIDTNVAVGFYQY